FKYVAPAIEAAGEACRLDADDFNLRIRYAELLAQDSRHDAATAELAIADELAGSPEDRETVLNAEIRVAQEAGTLGARTAELRQATGAEQGSARWIKLARYLEAGQQYPEALAAAREAIRRDGTSVPAWSAAARLYETSGDLGAAADAHRTLARLDRRART